MTAASSWELDPERYQRACFSRFPGCYCTNDEAVLDADPATGTVPVAFLTLLDGADPGTVRQEVNHDVTSQLGGGPQGDISAREDLAGLQAAQQAVAADAPRGA